MKRNIFLIGALAFASFGLQSCLDYDDPGSELGSNQIIDEETGKGQIDLIDYKKEITKEGFMEARKALTNAFMQGRAAQNILRGAKESEPTPKAHAYQQQYSLGTDGYAQYFVVSHKDFMYGTLTSTYNVSDEFNGSALYSYTGTKNSVMPLLHHQMIDSIPEMKAINLLYYCLSAQEHADLSGPFTYKEDKENSENPRTYNDLRTIYTGIVENLDTIVKCLQHYETRPQWYKDEMNTLLFEAIATTRDLLTGEQTGMTSFIKLANSLKLRMAMHIVKVEPELAKKWAEEACDPANGGVVESINEQQGIYPMVGGFTHPLIDIVNSWGDARLSASFESLLQSLKHPYLDYVFVKNANDIVNERTQEVTPANSVICGLRAGTLVGDGQNFGQNPYIAYSTINAQTFSQAPLYFLKWAEVDFLRAEGKIRGWNVGPMSAEEYYNRGIRNAYLDEPMMVEFGGSVYKDKVEEYLQLDKPVAYVNKDYRGGNEDWPSVTKIGVKWNEGDNLETKLEKIITQKYIALFPLSSEAWTELRRTGYPKLFPVLNPDDGDGSLMDGDIIRRIPWVETDPQKLETIMETGIPALGGEDFQGTRLWWDVDAPNF